ncbi:MAG: FAD-binding protein [Desulfobacterota bacterium]|nr:FAD-binding protein [Thermodesulfobacteriota bacterium]MDW8001884.1 FAD-binding protein [Deltaproteobacteria bacterium]
MIGNIREYEFETDVLIVGGGLAGNNAALGALEKNVKVIVADKGTLERCGATAGGVDHFMAYLNTGPWDTREAYLSYVAKIARGAVDLKVQDAVFCKELEAALERMEKIGCTLKQSDGKYLRTQSLGQPGPYFINFNGKNLKPALAKEARRLGVFALERCMMTDLLYDGERVIGAVGFNIRTGDFYIVKAKATILATGCTTRLFHNPTGLPFNTWQCPQNTGAAQVMAYKVGAKLANMEYMRITVVPKGFSAAGLNALMGMGGRLINAYGEEFMAKYHPMGNKAPRSMLVYAVMKEIQMGNGPIYIDCTHLSEADLNHLKRTLGYDKDTLPDFLEQKGVDLSKEPLEVMYSEGMQAGPSEVCGSGIMIDERTSSSIEGLFACGDCTDQMRCVHLCTTGGYLSGKVAAEYAKNYSHPIRVDKKEIQRLKEAIYRPLWVTGNLDHKTVENVIRRVMWEYAGPVRNEKSLNLAIDKLQSLKEEAQALKAKDFHELMRVHETNQLIDIGTIMCHASLERKETRFGIFHFRSDYPETKEEFEGEIVIFQKDGKVVKEFKKLSYDKIP